ncbi:hypothetical protein ACFU5O_02910 [Streptomyces sp. NPDC057445]|uniref:hypothetical protein n=1 Tax=Streptomyces sp. NPDC057445 TaxID=3346136 RepID=UPI0036C58384
MDLEKRDRRPEPEGCLTVAIRMPLRIVALVVVVPVRMVWDLLVVCGRWVGRVLLRPLGHLFAALFVHVLAPVGRALGTALRWLVRALFHRPWVALWRYAVVPVARWLYRYVMTPLGHGLVWAYARLLTPLGHGVGAVLWGVFVWPWTALWRYAVVPVVRYGIVVPLVHLYASVLSPLGRAGRIAVVWLAEVLVVAPAVLLYRWVLTPVGRFLVVVGRETADALVVAWRAAGYVSRAVGRALKWLGWNLLGRPATWFYRSVCTPAGHFVRDMLWQPARRAVAEAGRAVGGALRAARETVRQARKEAWRALVGGGGVHESGEPGAPRARNLGGTQATQQTLSAPGAAPGPEISLRKRG